jgi:(1->4)-alpha-D-glucan 1-alpha-D-glucosylmutase
LSRRPGRERSLGTAKIPRATYRLQLHRGFDFAAAGAVLPYLARLGISHVYCSPIATAQPGSLHGYDVIDPTRINPELGGREGFERFATQAHALGLFLLLDVVPNHMGIAGGRNAWWVDVLENGQASPFAAWFDIDWHGPNPALRSKVMLPVLDAPYGVVLDQGGIRLVFDLARGGFAFEFGKNRFPMEPRSIGALLAPVTHPGLRALGGEFSGLPQHDTPDPAARLRRREVQVDLQRRLARLVADDASAAEAVAGRVAALDTPSQREALDALHEAQAYRLMCWRSGVDGINYRRFFDVNDLAAVRVEDERVFEATQGLALDLAAAGWVDGLRVDHPDGLHDPAAYFARLQLGYARRRGLNAAQARARPLYVVVEKIEAAHEPLPNDWAVYGTTGYRFATLVGGLFVERRNALRMERIWRSEGGAPLGAAGDERQVIRDAKRQIAHGAFGAPLTELACLLRRIAIADRHTRDHGYTSLRTAIAEVAAAFPVYRTYLTADHGPTEQDRRQVDAAVAQALQTSHVADKALYEFLRIALLGDTVPNAAPGLAELARQFAMRFQQFSSPVAARGVEDTAFYRTLRLVSLNEVGGDPATFGLSAAAFHTANARRARDWPQTLLATSTHDNKRAEDVRQRISVLSEVPSAWKLALRRWRTGTRALRTRVQGAEAPSPAEQFLLLQTLLGTLPAEGLTDASLPEYRERIERYVLKAAREARQQTTWADPDPAHEAPLLGFVRGLLARTTANPALDELQARARDVAWYGALNSLSATVLKFTVPGVPDIYQGTELIDLSLVDPDNRRPVDHAHRAALLAQLDAMSADGLGGLAAMPTDGRLKLWLIWRLLALRRQHAEFFARADYTPLQVAGARRRHVVAFARRAGDATLVVVAGRRFVGLHAAPGQWPTGAAVWGDTAVTCPSWMVEPMSAQDCLSSRSMAIGGAPISLGHIFDLMPMAAFWMQDLRANG